MSTLAAPATFSSVGALNIAMGGVKSDQAGAKSFTADGKLIATNVVPTSITWVHGLPFNDAGELVIVDSAVAALPTYRANGVLIDANGAVVFVDHAAAILPIHEAQGLKFDANGAILAEGLFFTLNFLRGVLDPRVTFSRASNATQFDSLGRLVWAPANLIYYTNANNPAIGLSNTNVGGVWNASDTSAQGVQREVVGKGVIGGEDYIDIRVYGTNISGGNIFPDLIFHISATAPVAAVGELWTFAGKFQIVGGSGSGFLAGSARPRVQLRYMTSAGAYISGGPSTTLTEVEQFVVSSGAAPATTGRISGFIDLAIGPGGTVDCTIRVKAIRLERTGVDSPKAWIRNTTGTAYYGPRFDYNPQTLAARGLLIEEARTNLNPTYQGATTDWTANFCSVTNTGALILGNVAHTYTSTAGSSFCFLTATPIAFSPSSLYTSSVRVKRGNHPRVQFTVTNNQFLPAVADAYLNYNFDTDTLTVLGSVLPAPTGTRTLCADGSVVLTLTYTSGTAPTTGSSIIITCVDTDTAVRISGATATVGATVHFFGGQVEEGAFATSLIPTFGTAATRAIETATTTTPYSVAGMSVVVTGTLPLPLGGALRRLLTFHAGSPGTDSVEIGATSPAALGQMITRVGGVSTFDPNAAISPTVQPYGRVRIAARWSATDRAIAANGSGVTANAIDPPLIDLTTLQIGAQSVVCFNGTIESIQVYTKLLTNPELIAAGAL